MSDLSSKESSKGSTPARNAALLLSLGLAGCAVPRFQSNDDPLLEDGAIVRTIDPQQLASPLTVLAPDIGRPICDTKQISTFLQRLALPALEDLTSINAIFSNLASVGIHLDPESGRAHGLAEVSDGGCYNLEGIYRVQMVDREDGRQDKILHIKLLKNLLAGLELHLIQSSSIKESADCDTCLQVSCKFDAHIIAKIFGVQSLSTGGLIPVQREAGSPAQIDIINAEYVDHLAKLDPALAGLPARLKGLFERSKEISTELIFRNPDHDSSDYIMPRAIVADLVESRTGERLFVDMNWGSKIRTVEILGLLGGRVYFRNHLCDSRYFEGESPGRKEIVESGVESLSFSAFQSCNPSNFRELRQADLFIGERQERSVYISQALNPGSLELAAFEEFDSGLARFEALCGLAPGAITIFYGPSFERQSYSPLFDSAISGNSLLVQLRPAELGGSRRDMSELGFMRAVETFDRSFDILANSIIGLGHERRQQLGYLLQSCGWPVAAASSENWPESASAGVLYSLSRKNALDFKSAPSSAVSDYARALDDLRVEYKSSPLYDAQAPAGLAKLIEQRRAELSKIFANQRSVQEVEAQSLQESKPAVPNHSLKSLLTSARGPATTAATEGLSTKQIEQLRPIFQDSIDYQKVKIEHGPDWIFATNGNRAFVTGNTVHVPDDVTFSGDLLVHELTHVWQYQNGGFGYAFRALSAQMNSRKEFGSDQQAYSYARDLIAGKAWAELNPEQQAEIVVAASALIKNPGAALLVNPDGKQRIVSKVSAEGLLELDYIQLICHESYRDMTDFVFSALSELRQGHGARPRPSK